jgi:serpin B
MVPANIRQTANTINEFTIKLFHTLANEKNNVVISGLNINEAFTMLLAATDGETRKEIAQALGHTGPEKELLNELSIFKDFALKPEKKNQVKIKISNGLWPAKDLKVLEGYRQQMKSVFNATVKPLDFARKSRQAVDEINQTVSQQTEGKINKLFTYQSINAETRLVITSALYFKGLWHKAFKKQFTTDRKFYISEDEHVDIKMMNQTENYKYFEDENVQVICLPYKDLNYSLLIALPRDRNSTRNENSNLTGKLNNNNESLQNRDFTRINHISSQLSTELFEYWIDNLESKKIKLALPSFTVKNGYNLIPAFQALGVKRVFEADADFSKMTTEHNLFVSKAVHSTFLELTEEGTEAAAATGIAVGKSISRPRIIEMTIDHPFFFVIQEERSGAFLFAGKINNPAAAQ